MKTILTILLTTLSISSMWLFLIWRNLENVGDYYDIYWNSASGWICTSDEPSNAHPEMYFDWTTFEVGTRVVCEGLPTRTK